MTWCVPIVPGFVLQLRNNVRDKPTIWLGANGATMRNDEDVAPELAKFVLDCDSCWLPSQLRPKSST
jgi:hypothetical protein